MFYALRAGKSTAADALVRKGANVDAAIDAAAKAGILDDPSAGGVTMLMRAAARGDVPTLTTLLRHRAAPDATDDKGRTALAHAAAAGADGGIAALLQGGADAAAADGDGRTPLMAAALLGRRTAAEALARGGGSAALVAVDTAGRSALALVVLCALGTPPPPPAGAIGGPLTRDRAVETAEALLRAAGTAAANLFGASAADPSSTSVVEELAAAGASDLIARLAAAASGAAGTGGVSLVRRR